MVVREAKDITIMWNLREMIHSEGGKEWIFKDDDKGSPKHQYWQWRTTSNFWLKRNTLILLLVSINAIQGIGSLGKTAKK